MEQELEQIREQQRASWNKFSSGWKKWDALMMDFMLPVGDEIIKSLHLKEDNTVLDIAAGTGEPGLTIAALLKNGKVVLTDLAEDMLEIANENATLRGIKNIETLICDVSELPFPDNSFDAISCRFGFMFFPDMLLAAKEMARVLKPGGRIATAVWDVPEKNFWITATMGTINKNMNLQPPPSGSPGIFRCAQDQLIADLFRQVGLQNVNQKAVAGKLKSNTAEVYWNVMTEVAAPIVAALSKADDTMKDKIKQEVIQAVNNKFPDGNVQIDSSALIISGKKT